MFCKRETLPLLVVMWWNAWKSLRYLVRSTLKQQWIQQRSDSIIYLIISFIRREYRRLNKKPGEGGVGCGER